MSYTAPRAYKLSITGPYTLLGSQMVTDGNGVLVYECDVDSIMVLVKLDSYTSQTSKTQNPVPNKAIVNITSQNRLSGSEACSEDEYDEYEMSGFRNIDKKNMAAKVIHKFFFK